MRIQVEECDSISLTDCSCCADIVLKEDRNISAGDRIALAWGLHTLLDGEVIDCEEREGKWHVELEAVSVASSCCMTSEIPVIAAFSEQLRNFLATGGCCGTPLLNRAMLRRIIDGIFIEAARLYGEGQEIPPPGTSGHQFAHSGGKIDDHIQTSQNRFYENGIFPGFD